MSKEVEDFVVVNDSLEWYTDGGTIGINCYGVYKGHSLKDYGNIITIDKSLSTPKEEQLEWYIGWKDKDGVLIEDKEFKEKVIEDIKVREQILNQLLYRSIIPSLYKK